MGVSDPNSQAGQQGLVDPTQFARANQAIQMACQNLVDPACTQSQVSVRWGTVTGVFSHERDEAGEKSCVPRVGQGYG